MLKNIAGAQQSFIDRAKRLDDKIDQVRAKSGDNPKASEGAIELYTGMKAGLAAAERAVLPLRDLVVQTAKEAKAIYAELGFYPEIFAEGIQISELYRDALGSPSDFNAVVNALAQAREHLRRVVETISQAAKKAEAAIRYVPTTANQPTT